MVSRVTRALAGLVVVSLIAGCVDVVVVPTPPAGSSLAPGSSSPAPSPSAAPPSVTYGPSGAPPTIAADLRAQIDAVTSAMPAIRQLTATREVPYEFISRDQFTQDIAELNNQDTPPEVQAAQERLLKRLGLLPADADLQALLVELYSGQVAAFYRPDTKTFYIIARDQPFGPTDEVTVAHEYTHALQDMHFDLAANTISDPSEGDAALAQLAVIEGDATLASQIWMLENLTLDQMLQMLNESLGEVDMQQLASMPPILRRELEFPYTDGLTFVSDLYCGQSSCLGEGNWQPIDDALVTPPASTEQILHPEKYGVDQPVTIDLPDLSGSLGEGWSQTLTQTLGELDIEVLMAGDEAPAEVLPGLPVEWPHSEAAAGWGGDRLAMYEGPNDAWLIDWQTAWDTPADAQEFVARVNQLRPSFQGDSETFALSDKVHVAIASDHALLSATGLPVAQ
jgi:hypothetical protein